MVNRRAFLNALARTAAVCGLATLMPSRVPGKEAVSRNSGTSAGGAPDRQRSTTSDANGSRSISDIWGQPDNYFQTLEMGADKTKSPYERYLYDVLDETYSGQDWKRVSWPEDRKLGHRHLRIHWNNRYRSGSFSIPIFRGHTSGNSDPTEGRVVHCRYMVRISDNFSRAVIDDGKWLGFCSSGKPRTGRQANWPNESAGLRGGLLAGNGLSNIHGNDGWSARGGFRARLKGAPDPAPVPLYTYTYILDRELPDGRIELQNELLKRYEEKLGLAPGSNYIVKMSPKELRQQLLQPGEILPGRVTRMGVELKWDLVGPTQGVLIPGRWHRVDQIMSINTPGVRDGWLHAFIDGRQVGQLEKLRWRNPGPYVLTERYKVPTTLGIGSIWGNFYQGGGDLYRKMTDEAHVDVYGVAIKVLEWDEPRRS